MLIAGAGALGFGTVFWASGNVVHLQPAWVVAASRCVPCGLAVVVCHRRGLLWAPARARRWIVGAGALDSLGYTLYIHASRQGVAVAAVAASQYAVVAALGGTAGLGERMRRIQWLGVAMLMVAAALVALQSG